MLLALAVGAAHPPSTDPPTRFCFQLQNPCYGQRPEGEKNFSERPCCHSRHHHRTATVAAAFERPVVASAAEEPIRTGSDDRAAFVASTITPFLVELHLTDGDATIVSVGRIAAEIGIGVVSGKAIFGPPLDDYWKKKLQEEAAAKESDANSN
ncbi:hypothetical protein LWI29_036618 [Acer saccharum]|uniref:Uncharacterized protein n=1 Tax=Acer saccharum TaxID=4024 RepID=A0AA39TUD1_ACESA|nr:hypothetical protein LWI29_036618 [Acer saccharum]